MKLKVLGSGSSGNCYLLESENEALLIECGVKFSEVKKAVNFNISKISGCLITHEHGDHCKAVKDVQKSGIRIVASKGTTEKILGQTDNIIIKYTKNIVGNFEVIPFDVVHDAIEPLGFLIRHQEIGVMLFATDLGYSPVKFSGLNHILIECNYSLKILNHNVKNGFVPRKNYDRIINGHMGLETTKELLEINDLSGVKNIVLLHLSDKNSNEKEFMEEIQNQTGKPTYVAKKGLEINLSINPF